MKILRIICTIPLSIIGAVFMVIGVIGLVFLWAGESILTYYDII